MPKAIATPTHHEMVSDDGSISIEVTHTSGYTNILETEERWPIGLGMPDVKMALIESSVANGTVADEDEARAWLNFVAPDHPAQGIADIKRFRGIVDGLGYSLDEERQNQKGQVTTKRRFAYPSIDCINDFAAGAFGEDRLHFAPHDGSEYGTIEFMERFAGEGQVLVASELPLAPHDLSDHVLGWIGMSNPLVRTLRQGLGAYLAHAKASQAIAELERLPIDTERLEDDPQLQEFMFPSLTVLKIAMTNLDMGTSQIVSAAMVANDMRDDLYRVKLEEAVDSLFSIRSYSHGVSLPGHLFDTDLNLKIVVSDILDRYRRADEVGREMASSAR